MKDFNLDDLVRENIKNLKPYSSARNEFTGEASVFLDANENAYGSPVLFSSSTGEGTGLGLSLSYDIVKAHGGEIKVETKEGEGAEFIIQLPVV